MTPTALRLIRLESRLTPAVATWDGGGADNHWTTAANWVGDVAPNPGDDLVFPSGAAQLSNVNDFPDGTAFHTIGQAQNDSFPAPYQFSGNAIALAAGLHLDANNPSEVMGLPITLTADQTFTGSGFTLTRAVNLNGHALTVDGVYSIFIAGAISGTGSVTFAGGYVVLKGANTYTGPTVLNSGQLWVDGVIPGPITVVRGPKGGSSTLSGLGTVGDVAVGDDNSAISPGPSFGGTPPPTGSLTTGSLTLQGPTSMASLTAGAYSLNVHGSVHLSGTLNLFLATTRPGDQVTLINNDGTDPIVGTFSNAPEGALLGGASFSYRLNYHGGDGNDLVATVVSGPSFAVGAGAGGVPIVNVYGADGSLPSKTFPGRRHRRCAIDRRQRNRHARDRGRAGRRSARQDLAGDQRRRHAGAEFLRVRPGVPGRRVRRLTRFRKSLASGGVHPRRETVSRWG
jgi:hypothetical protein